MYTKLWNEATQIAFELVNQPGSIHLAFLYRKNKLISIGRNNREHENAKALYFAKLFSVSHWQKYPFIHAEIDAISRAWKNHYIDNHYTIISLRINKPQGYVPKFKLCLAKPCVNCTKVLKVLSCKVLYSDKEGQCQSI